jgi:ApbE superfamily uncharacterized protein (UPF0280 family)
LAGYEERKYREWIKQDDLVAVKVIEDETDLLVSGTSDLTEPAKKSVSKYRKHIKDYIVEDRNFLESLVPIEVDPDAPEIVKDMARAASMAGVGPMAAVAGAVAEFVARDLLSLSKQIIIENGGDIFIKTLTKRLLGVYAGKSPFTGKIALQIKPEQTPMGVCTSSGTVGHSLSFGKADAAIILSRWIALADAVATATGNVVKTEEDIQKGVDFARSIEGVEGVIVILGSKIGMWGDIDIARI